MSSRIERNAVVVFVLGESFCAGDTNGVAGDLKVALTALRPFISQKNNIGVDKQMARAIHKTLLFVKQWIGQDTIMPPDIYLAYVHMLSAIVSDFYLQIPNLPPDRKQAWLAYNNAIATLIDTMLDNDKDDMCGVDLGCQWAAIIQTMLTK